MRLEKGKVIFESEEELLPVAMSLQTTDYNATGSWKYLQPYYKDTTPPCVNSCMAGNDIVTFMRLIEEGRYEEAALGVLDHNPFPATLGRVCPHPCETPCNRKALGGGIAIQSAERFLGDYAIEHNLAPRFPPVEYQSVTVVGSGAAGLTAAYFLRKLGHDVTVIEAEEAAGGLLWSGIPPFRLPRQVLDRELDRIRNAPEVTFRHGIRLGEHISVDALRSEAQAVLLAVGFGSSRPLGIPGEDHPMVVDGIKILRQLHRGEKPALGKRVAVIGGGNTAVDCARSFQRLGHEVTILYRRTKTEMPAFKDEVAEALEERIKLEFLTAPSRAVVQDGALVGLECIRMKLGEPDASRRRRPIPIEGSEFLVPVDAVVKALGEILAEDELPPAIHSKGNIEAKEYQTGMPGVFACGDAAGDCGTVAQAMAAGRGAAHAIHAYLTGKPLAPPNPLRDRGASKEIAKFKQFNTAYFREEPGFKHRLRPAAERIADFNEVRQGLSEQEIRSEAARCFKCGTCTLCDNCATFCPDNAIRKKADMSGYEILYDYCKGCLVCVEECPRAAIHMQKVEE